MLRKNVGHGGARAVGDSDKYTEEYKIYAAKRNY
jgi:hypothetical protein